LNMDFLLMQSLAIWKPEAVRDMRQRATGEIGESRIARSQEEFERMMKEGANG
jgi:hypothetical protein